MYTTKYSRSQLAEFFRLFTELHYPNNWPELLPTLIALLNENNLNTLETALDCLILLVKRYT